MAAVIPDPNKTRDFKDGATFERWLAKYHARETELWLKIHKKDSGLATVTYAEALDVALCWGWIDGLKKSFDENSFLQRFTPRKAKSIWSQINREHVARLVSAGRMSEHGQKHIDAAKKDGRWDAAYASQSQMKFPDDLAKSIKAVPKAHATFKKLSKVNLYALAHRMQNLKTVKGRAAATERFVAMLARGDMPHPQG
jgi:uncharacterized protein YdeI (YjbR/CyaY-like superfamily)